MTFDIRVAAWEQDREAIKAVREQVFVVEQQVDPALEWDGLDEDCEHAIVSLADGTIVGTGRAHFAGDTAKVGRMAVLKEHRGKGIGMAILDFLTGLAWRRGLARVHLNAQTHALNFYGRAGFVAEGPEFDEANIPHRKMTLEFSLVNKPTEGVDVAQPAAGGSPEATVDSAADQNPRLISGHAAIEQAARDVASMATRELTIYSNKLAARFYENEQFLEIVRQLAISTPHSRVRILVRLPAAAVGNAPKFVDLARQLSSSIAVKAVAEHHRHRQVTFIVADDRAVVYHPTPDSGAAVLEMQPGKAKHYLGVFESMWEAADDDAALRPMFA